MRNRLIKLLGGYTEEEFHQLEIDRDVYEDDCDSLQRENKNLEVALEKCRAANKRLLELADNTPDDCIRGKWCKGCAFAKKVYVTDGYGTEMQKYWTSFCGKSTVCKHYQQAKEEKV